MIKKFLIFCAISLICINAHATTMCVADDAMAIVLDAQVAGTNHGYNEDLFEWSSTFPYGTVFGIAACVTTSGGSGTDTLIDTDTGDVVKGGERTGQYCWCRMTHPVMSQWVPHRPFGTADNCKINCASYCGGYVRDNPSFRGSVFGSVGN